MKPLSLKSAALRVRAALGHRVAGYCYVASEAIYHLAGGRRAGLTPMVLGSRSPWGREGSHWFLRDRTGRIIDVTAGQFRPPLRRAEYAAARGCGFLTKRPSSGARAIIELVRAAGRGSRRARRILREWSPYRQSPTWYKQAARSKALKVLRGA